jgi:hypothetical protein
MPLFPEQGVFALGVAVGVLGLGLMLGLVLLLRMFVSHACEEPALLSGLQLQLRHAIGNSELAARIGGGRFAIVPHGLAGDKSITLLASQFAEWPRSHRTRSILFVAGRELTLPADLKVEPAY